MLGMILSLRWNAQVVHLQKRFWVEAKTYPHFTVLGQSLGSMVLGMEALMKCTPLIFFDTSGYAFIYPLARAFGCKVVCYTHYPTVSSDMFARVLGRTTLYNNNNFIARRQVKLYFIGKFWPYDKHSNQWVLKVKCVLCLFAVYSSLYLRLSITYWWQYYMASLAVMQILLW